MAADTSGAFFHITYVHIVSACLVKQHRVWLVSREHKTRTTVEWPHVQFGRDRTACWRAGSVLTRSPFCPPPPHGVGDAPETPHHKTRTMVEWPHVHFGPDRTTRWRAGRVLARLPPDPPGGSPPREGPHHKTRHTTRRALSKTGQMCILVPIGPRVGA